MAEKRSHVNLIEDKEVQYDVTIPASMHRAVFWGDNLTMGRNVLPAGEHLQAHSHPQEQYTMILEGECDCRCGDETFHMTPGSICFAPSNVEHELWMWEESDVVALDFFYPMREDWITPLDEK